MQFRNKINGDVITVHGPVADLYAARPLDWERMFTADELAEIADQVAGLKGHGLDQALVDAGLPTSGLADEKRERLLDATVTTPDPVSDNPADVTPEPGTAGDNTPEEN